MKCFDCGCRVGGFFGKKGFDVGGLFKITFCENCAQKEENKKIIRDTIKKGELPSYVLNKIT